MGRVGSSRIASVNIDYSLLMLPCYLFFYDMLLFSPNSEYVIKKILPHPSWKFGGFQAFPEFHLAGLSAVQPRINTVCLYSAEDWLFLYSPEWMTCRVSLSCGFAYAASPRVTQQCTYSRHNFAQAFMYETSKSAVCSAVRSQGIPLIRW